MKDPAGADLEAREYQLDRHGLLIPAVNRFPSAAHAGGLRSLADWTHHHGLKLGIHIVRGIPRRAVRENLPIADSAFQAIDAADIADTCPWDDGNYGVRDNEAGQAYYDSMFKLFAAWKVDFVKVDCIASRPYKASEIRQIATAIHHAGRPMVLSLSPGPTDVSHAEEVGRYAQMWRISNDIWDGWSFEHDGIWRQAYRVHAGIISRGINDYQETALCDDDYGCRWIQPVAFCAGADAGTP